MAIALASFVSAGATAPVVLACDGLPASIDAPGGEAWIAHHPEGQLILFGRHDKDWSNHRLFMTRCMGGAWTVPEPVPFTATSDGKAPHFAPDGQSLLFASTRPRPGAAAAGDLNIWRVRWDGARWGEPELLPAPINSDADEIDAVETAAGAIYFSSTRDEGSGRRADLYRATPRGDGYSVATLTGLSTELVESTLFVMPDESVIVFSRDGDPAGLGMDDLFYARRQGDAWSAPTHLQGAANSPEYEYGPELSRDGRTLYLTTHRGGQASIIAIDAHAAMAQ